MKKKNYIETIVDDLTSAWTPIHEARCVFIEHVLDAITEIDSPMKEDILVHAIMRLTVAERSRSEKQAA